MNQKEHKQLFLVSGMTYGHCKACVRRVEIGLRKIPTVVEASVNLATERASVRFDHSQNDNTFLVLRDLQDDFLTSVINTNAI